MKKLFMTVIVIGIVCGALTAWAQDKKQPKYQVELRIVYNAVDALKAADLVRLALDRHSGACDVDVKVIRAGTHILDLSTITIQPSSPYTLESNDLVYRNGTMLRENLK